MSKTQSISSPVSLTDTEFSELKRRAIASKSLAYCPYSKFRVGCTILTHSGDYVDGANVENAAYPVGTCAERVALGRAVVEGYFAADTAVKNGSETPVTGKARGFKALAVATDITPPASPCGMCRQFIREFCDLQTPIYMFDKNEEYIVKTLQDMLPMSFGPEALPPPGPSA